MQLRKFMCLCLGSLVTARNYLLVPRGDNKMMSNVLMKKYNLDILMRMEMDEEFIVYRMGGDDYTVYSEEVESLFEVEEDIMFTLPKPIVEDKSEFIYVQGPGEFYFKESNVSYDVKRVPWHLDRISKRDLPLNNEYEYDKVGSCHRSKNVTIHTYVVDTGIDVLHHEFEGRAEWLANFADKRDTDCHSHGTHCAGLVGSKTYGVCKDAKLFAVKVLDCRGSGAFSGILSGLDYVYKHHKQQMRENANVKSIVSMSLGGGFSSTINRAVEALIKDDSMYVVVAAGNEDSDACNTSPASARGILTIMASDKYDNRAYFSNYGKCADMYSPGVDILSTVPNDETAVYSGTSMATPILVGVLNHYLDQYSDLNMKMIKEKLLSDASKDKLSNNPKHTNNLLVYVNRD